MDVNNNFIEIMYSSEPETWSSFDESNAPLKEVFFYIRQEHTLICKTCARFHLLFSFKNWRLFDSTVTQAVRDIGQRYHRYMPKQARNKANIMHIGEQDMMS